MGTLTHLMQRKLDKPLPQARWAERLWMDPQQALEIADGWTVGFTADPQAEWVELHLHNRTKPVLTTRFRAGGYADWRPTVPFLFVPKALNQGPNGPRLLLEWRWTPANLGWPNTDWDKGVWS